MRPENSRAGCALGHARRCYITAEFSLAQALGFALLVQKTDRSRQAPFLLRAVALSLQWAVASLASAEPDFAQLVLLPIVLKDHLRVYRPAGFVRVDQQHGGVTVVNIPQLDLSCGAAPGHTSYLITSKWRNVKIKR